MEERTLSQEQPDLLSTNLNIDLNADPNNIDLNADPNRDMNEEPSSRKRKIGPSDGLSKANHNTTNICKYVFMSQKSHFFQENMKTTLYLFPFCS